MRVCLNIGAPVSKKPMMKIITKRAAKINKPIKDKNKSKNRITLYLLSLSKAFSAPLVTLFSAAIQIQFVCGSKNNILSQLVVKQPLN